MKDSPLYALTFVAVLGAGLIGGLFFAFSALVMTALGRLAPAGGIAAMQSINVAVLNPVSTEQRLKARLEVVDCGQDASDLLLPRRVKYHMIRGSGVADAARPA